MKEQIEYKITDEQFDFFKQIVKDYTEILNLKDWDIRIIKDEFRKEHKDMLAGSWADHTKKCAEIMINENWDDIEPTKNELRITAIHELLEILLHELGEMAAKTYNIDLVMGKKHNIIHVLEKLL